ncbi:MAG: FKBP-type peptidyl-prolyl cis-trans isomerase [Bacteroidetes bacterium]|nr:FKBP-type peptidyl-prolyl cis-trans isomerase [Bacteroidota bacterium]
MKKLNQLMLLAVVMIFAAACNKVDYKKTSSGLAYQLFPSNGKDSLIKNGEVIKMEATTKLNDSLLYSSYGKMPVYLKLQDVGANYNILEILRLMKVGDSAVVVQLADSLMKRQDQMPPMAKKGDRIITTMKILKVYNNDSIAMIDYTADMEKDKPRQEKEQAEMMAKMEKEKKAKLVEESKEIEKYLAEKNIKTEKTPSGVYVQILNPGTGNQIDSGKYISVNYTGKTFAGFKFDSNVDTAFHHTQPLEFTVDAPGMTEGFNDGMKLLRKGADAIFYIPSVLAYGANPNPASGIKPYENLIFDVKILDVQDKQPAPQQPAMRKPVN